jgi:hypothetical protein
MSIAAIVLSVISLVLGGVNLLLMVLMCAAWNDFKENWERLKEQVEPAEKTVSPAARLACVGSFATEAEDTKQRWRNYSALNGCLKVMEAVGVTYEEAQTIPAQLEKAIAFGSAQNLHNTAFKAFKISKEPDGIGGYKDEPKGYSSFTAYGN